MSVRLSLLNDLLRELDRTIRLATLTRNTLTSWALEMAHKLDEQFTLTTSAVAREVDPPCDPSTVRDYADWGLIECFRLASGVRLFKPSAAAEVIRIRAERLSRRGGNTRRAPAAA
jgi:hypothetical protein